MLREALHSDAAFIAAGESARGLIQGTNENDEAYWGRVGRAAVDAYRSAARPKADAIRILNLLMPFGESLERNRDFAAVASETTHFIRDLSLFAEPMAIEPRLEPAARLGIKIASVAGIVVLGIALIVYGPEIQAVLNLG